MSGGSGGGWKSGRGGGGGGGGGLDTTTPVSEMGLDRTITQIYETRQAISSHAQDMNSDKFYSGTREDRKAMRAKTEMLDKRLTDLTNSVNRGVRKIDNENVIVMSKGKERRILEKWSGQFPSHYGPNPKKY